MDGRIDTSKLHTQPEEHELSTARLLSKLGYDIDFLPTSNSPSIHVPDILMDGVAWEIKSPKGKSRRTIENNFRLAMAQSDSIIFDLRRIKISERKCLSELEHRFNQKKSVKRLWIIRKDGGLLKYSR